MASVLARALGLIRIREYWHLPAYRLANAPKLASASEEGKKTAKPGEEAIPWDIRGIAAALRHDR